MPTPVITLITYITTNIWFKIAYGVTLTTQTMFLVQESVITNEKLLSVFLENTPAKVLYGVSLIFISAIALERLSKAASGLSKAWKDHQVNKIEVKMKQEDLETKEIDNDKHRKDLNL